MLAAGAEVVLIDRAEDRLAALCAELGPKAHPLVVDLMDGASGLGRCCRGSSSWPAASTSSTPTPAPTSAATVVEGDPDAWDRMLNLNVNAAFRSVHAVLPHMVERKTGDIVVTSSIAGARAGGLGADLHRVEVRGAGLRRTPSGAR